MKHSILSLTIASLFSVVSVEGRQTDWIQGLPSESCTSACQAIGNSDCNALGTASIKSMGDMQFVVNLINEDENSDLVRGYSTCTSYHEEVQYLDVVPSQSQRGDCHYDSRMLDAGQFYDGISYCESSLDGDARICCCGDNCPVYHHWVQGEIGDSCTETCQNVAGGEGVCDSEAMEAVNTYERFQYVVNLIQEDTNLRYGPCADIIEDDVFPHTTPSQVSGTGECFFDADSAHQREIADCDTGIGSDARICCCGGNCPFE